MRIVRIATAIVLVLVVAIVVAAPIGPMPGLFIGGTATAAPERWPDTSEVHEIRLKVPGTLPRVVIIWVVDVGGELYVVGSRDSGWVKMIGQGAPVEMRLEDSTYALRATPVAGDPSTILQSYVAKYEPDYPDIIAGMPDLEEARDVAAVFRLERP